MTTTPHIVTAFIDWTNIDPEGPEHEVLVKVLNRTSVFTLPELKSLGIHPPKPDPQVGDLIQMPSSKTMGVVAEEQKCGYYLIDFGYVQSSKHKDDFIVLGKVVS